MYIYIYIYTSGVYCRKGSARPINSSTHQPNIPRHGGGVGPQGNWIHVRMYIYVYMYTYMYM